MSSVKIKIIGAKKASRNLDRMAFQLGSFGDAFDQIGEDFRFQVFSQFTAHGAFPGVGGMWAPLKPYTIRARGGTRAQLEHTGNLLSSYVDPLDRYNITYTGAMEARFGSAYKARNGRGRLVPVAAYHQMGTRYMVARPVVLATQYMETKILDAFSAHITEGWVR